MNPQVKKIIYLQQELQSRIQALKNEIEQSSNHAANLEQEKVELKVCILILLYLNTNMNKYVI